jgi:hypothetical protein
MTTRPSLLEALERFFRAMPARSGMAFVIVMHLAPDRKSELTEIIARFTDMNVQVACDGPGRSGGEGKPGEQSSSGGRPRDGRP